MPIYEYKCEETGNIFEAQQSIKAEPLTHCIISNCECQGKGKVQKLISKNIGLLFSGSGFYQTDYVTKTANTEPHSTGCSCCKQAKSCPASNE